MKRSLIALARFSAVFLAVCSFVFSSIPYEALNFLISDYVRSYKVVDEAITALAPKTAEARIEFAGDGVFYYGQNANTNPRQRFWSQSNLAFGAASTTVASSTPRQARIQASPTQREMIAGYVNASGQLTIACFNGETWTNEWGVSVGGTGTTRRFDIAYEKTTGDVMVLYSGNASTTNELRYRTKSGGTGCGTANWSAATNLDPVRTSGMVWWVRLESQPTSGSNRIAAMWLDGARDVSVMHWDGSAWADEPAAALETNTESTATTIIADTESFDLAWESLSGELMVVMSSISGTNGTGATFWSTSTCTASCTWRSATSSIAILDDATHLDITADPLSDQIAFYALGNAGADTSAAIWNGNTWTASANRDTAAAAPSAGRQFVATGWLTNGGTKRAVAVYYDSGTTNIGWDVANGTTWTLQTDFTPTPAFGTQTQYMIHMNPYNRSELLLEVGDSNSDVFVKRLTMTATPAFTWTNADGGAALEATGPSNAYPWYDFAYWDYIRPAVQVVQGTDPVGQTIGPGAATTTANGFRLRTSTSTETITQVTVDLNVFDIVPAYDAISAVQIFRPGDSTSLGITYNPGSDIVNVAVSGMTATTSSSTPYEVRITPKSHANMPAPPGLSHPIYAAVTSVTTASGAHSESFDILADDLTLDNAAPDEVTDASVTAGDAANTLAWANPEGFGDPDFDSSIVLRRTGGAVTDVPVEGTTYATSSTIGASTVICSGSQTTCTDGSLTNGTAYHYRIYTRDLRGNWSAGVVPTGSPATPAAPTFEQSNYRLFGNLGTRTEFGTGGVVTAASAAQSAYDIATDGTWLYIVGFDENGDSRIEKRNAATGALDSNFGSAGVVVGETLSYELQSIAIDSTWMYVFGADDNGAWRIEKRSLATGAVDGGFGTSGLITSAGGAAAKSIVIDGTSMYLAGWDSSINWRIEKRGLSTGGLDGSFGTSGVVTGAALTATVGDIMIDSTWLYIVGDDDNGDWRIEKRSLSTGGLDGGFGISGVVTGASETSSAQSIATDGTHMYVAGFDSSPDWRLEKRLLSTGELAAGFGSAGVVTSAAISYYAYDILSKDGWLYIAGYEGNPTTDMRIEKRDPANGSLDPNFGSAGILTNSTSAEAYRAISTGEWLYLVGRNDGSNDFNIERRTLGTGALAQNVDLGMPLAAQNSSTTLASANGQFRLRQLVRVGTTPQAVNGGSRAWKLQYSVRSGTCDASFTGESYADVTGATPIAYFDNTASGMTDGVEITATSTDPTGVSSSIVRPQTYEEANNFANSVAAVAVGENMLFDFSLRDNSAPAGTTYCLRIVNSGGSAMDTYTQVPEVRTYSVPGITISGTFFDTDGTTPIGDITSLKLAVGPSTSYTTGAAGAFTFSSVTQPADGTVMTLWTTSGATGTAVFKYGANCTGFPNCTGLSLLRDHVFLSSFASDPGASAITNSDLSACDNNSGTVCGQTPSVRIGFTANAGDGPVDFVATNPAASSTLRIGAGTTYSPDGSVTAPNIQVDGTLDTGSQSIIVTDWGTSNTCGYAAGNDPAPLCVNGGSIAGSGTITFTTPTSTAVQSRAYPRLSLQSSSGASPTYSLVGTSAFSASDLFVGESAFGANVTFSASTTNPTMTIENLTIDAGSTLVCSTSTVTISGNFDNSGYIDNRGNTIAFTATAGGRTFNPGLSVRTGSSGSLDVSFDGDGVAVSSGGGSIKAVAKDSRWLYLVGDTDTFDMRIEKRSLATGALDPDFGSSGVVTSDASADYAYAIAIDAGSMYVAGSGNDEWRIEKRSLATGALDPDFGTGGVVSTADGYVATGIAIDSSWMYVAGNANLFGGGRVEKRSLATGALDQGFGTNGVIDLSASYDNINDIEIDTDYLYIAGEQGLTRIEKRSLYDGSLDVNFGTGGVVTGSLLNQRAYDIEIVTISGDVDPWIYIAGGDATTRVEKRSAYSGALDTNFGTAGVVSGAADTAIVNALAADTFAFYMASDGPGQNWRLEKRSLATGALDTSFGESGIVTSAAVTNAPEDIVLSGNGIYVVGYQGDSPYDWRVEKRFKDSGKGRFMNADRMAPFSSEESSVDYEGELMAVGAGVLYTLQTDFSMSPVGYRMTKRFAPSNDLDEAFGSSGVLSLPSLGYDDSPAQDASVFELSGALFISGMDNATAGWRIEKRNTSTGALNTGFNSTGVVVSSGGSGVGKMINDGTNLYIYGTDSSSFWRVEKRSSATGALVTAFGTSGVVTSSFGLGSVRSAVVTGSSIYLLGYDNDFNWRLEKRNATTGALDGSFGTLGVISITGPEGSGITITSLETDGSALFLVGRSGGSLRVEKRQLTDGALVSGFGTSGVATPVPAASEPVDSFISGSWIYAQYGYSEGNPRITKVSTSDGALDMTFGNLGVGEFSINTELIHLYNGVIYGSWGLRISDSFRYVPHFPSLSFTGSGGWTMAENALLSVEGDLTVSNGTFGGSGSVNAYGDVTGNGTINFTDGRFIKIDGGSFGGDAAWTFDRLFFFEDPYAETVGGGTL